MDRDILDTAKDPVTGWLWVCFGGSNARGWQWACESRGGGTSHCVEYYPGDRIGHDSLERAITAGVQHNGPNET